MKCAPEELVHFGAMLKGKKMSVGRGEKKELRKVNKIEFEDFL